jgi:pyruvate dehydrogenase E2 component (dihydrolipoamide acetyltransferase)
MRQVIAKRLLESKTTIPHFYVTTEIDMEALLSLRSQINASAKSDAEKISVNDCLMKAVAVALGENPKVNAKFDNNSRVVSHGKHIGFGVSVDDGLIVPVVRNCEGKNVRQIAAETKPLIEKARAGKLSPAEYTGGTFTISNMGVFPDIEDFAAIINPGEGAILAVASTREVPAVVKGQIVPRKRMKVTLSADHRVVDGADGAQFLITLKRVMENPLEILL